MDTSHCTLVVIVIGFIYVYGHYWLITLGGYRTRLV